jgi:cytochrome P450
MRGMGQAVIAAEADAQRLANVLEELVVDCQKRQPTAGDDKSISGHLLRLRDAEGRQLSFRRLVQEFFIFFLAGSETTGHTIAWTLCAHLSACVLSQRLCLRKAKGN